MKELEDYKKQVEKLSREEITACSKSIEATKSIIDKAVVLNREICSKLCSRNFDPEDRRMVEACAASRHVEDAIECLSKIVGYDTSTIAIDRANIEND